MEKKSTGVTFSLSELWVLQGAIRHDAPSRREQWPSNPPASLSLNDLVADAILSCETSDLREYTLPLTLEDALAIDYCVGQGVKDSSGKLVGKAILLKSFQVRRDLGNTIIGEGVLESPDYSSSDLNKFLSGE